ncbi:MAG: hypothetical protein WC003_11515 [Terrimicrobiaceae bacterium]
MNIRKLWTELFQKPAGRLILFLLAGALVFAFLFSGKGHRSTEAINPAVPAQATTAKGYSFTEEIPVIPPARPPSPFPKVPARLSTGENRVISFFRMKTRWRNQQPPQIRFGKDVEAILATLPKIGQLFPYLATVRPGDRATEFKQRCLGLGIHGVSLHSYRYAWAERAKVVGYPERFAQLALGHNSKAVHRAYARKAQVTLPPLEEYEQKIVAFTPAIASPENIQTATIAS